MEGYMMSKRIGRLLLGIGLIVGGTAAASAGGNFSLFIGGAGPAPYYAPAPVYGPPAYYPAPYHYGHYYQPAPVYGFNYWGGHGHHHHHHGGWHHGHGHHHHHHHH